MKTWILVLAAASLAACGDKEPTAPAAGTVPPVGSPGVNPSTPGGFDPNSIQFDPNRPLGQPPMPTAGSVVKENPEDYPDLEIEVLAEGEGDPLAWEETGKFHYTGVLLNGKQFDSSYNTGLPLEANLSTGGVVKGWQLGLQDMKVGEKRRVKVPAELGYGKSGRGDVPPDATMVFTVELVEKVGSGGS